MAPKQLELPTEPSRFDANNMGRLNRLLDRVYRLMRDGKPRTLRQIADACNGGEASCSARLREIRSNGCAIEKFEDEGIKGLWWYYMTEDGQ